METDRAPRPDAFRADAGGWKTQGHPLRLREIEQPSEAHQVGQCGPDLGDRRKHRLQGWGDALRRQGQGGQERNDLLDI